MREINARNEQVESTTPRVGDLSAGGEPSLVRDADTAVLSTEFAISLAREGNPIVKQAADRRGDAEGIRQQVRRKCASGWPDPVKAKNPAIFCSFGKDSLLVLRLALEAGFSGPIYHLGTELSAFAQQEILDRDLTVFAWPPADRYLVPDGEGLAQVDEFVVGSVRLPTISPVTRGEKCDHGEYPRFTRPFNFPHDMALTGYKKADRNSVIGTVFAREVNIGPTRLVNLLYDWTDEQVIDALGFTPPEENAVEYCNECLAIIHSSGWDRDAALASFRRRFNFH